MRELEVNDTPKSTNPFDIFVEHMYNASWSAIRALLFQRHNDYLHACETRSPLVRQRMKAELSSDVELWAGKDRKRRGMVEEYLDTLRKEAYG